MATYIKKPIKIEAFKLGTDPIPDWFVDNLINGFATTSFEKDGKPFETTSPFQDASNYIVADIKTLEGTMRADNGDYIIQGVKGEIYPCKPDIFELSYDMADIINNDNKKVKKD